MIPAGNPGKQFVSELASLFRAYAEGSVLECIALKVTTVLAILALQKPHQKSKSKDHKSCLERRLKNWKEGNLQDLLQEGRTIQKGLRKAVPKINKDTSTSSARSFAKLMFEGKCGAALKMLSGAF